jgi:aryl-alcohol dehydrogenase-like predicted oxidoreductase
VIEEVAGAVKDLIKAGRARQFGMSEAAAGTIRQPKERAGHLVSRPMVMSTPQSRRRQLDVG